MIIEYLQSLQAGYSANPTNTSSIEMLDITFVLTAGALGGNTVQIVPTLTLNDRRSTPNNNKDKNIRKWCI